MALTAHTKEQKEFIVRRLAAFYTARDIAAAFIARWPDTKCDDADVAANDPRFVILDPDLHVAFYAERERVIADPDSAPYAKQQARLIALSHDVERYRNNNQPAEARAVMRQIAEEMGVVGGSKATGKPAAVPEGEEVVAITRTIVDPTHAGPDAQHSDAAGVPAPVGQPSV